MCVCTPHNLVDAAVVPHEGIALMLMGASRLLDRTPTVVEYIFSESKVNADELFERFPHLLFASFRNQMLLGKVPAQTVQAVLEPLLSDFHELMLQLPPGLQTDLENILRIYPEVAESFGVWIKPPILESLRLFAHYWFKAGRRAAPTSLEFDMAAESQQRLGGPTTPFVKEGQGFFTTDKGSSVYLEFFYSEGDDCASFQYRPLKFAIEIHICGIYSLTLSPSKPKRKIQADQLFDILMKCARKVSVQVTEADANPAENGAASLPICS